MRAFTYDLARLAKMAGESEEHLREISENILAVAEWVDDNEEDEEEAMSSEREEKRLDVCVCLAVHWYRREHPEVMHATEYSEEVEEALHAKAEEFWEMTNMQLALVALAF